MNTSGKMPLFASLLVLALVLSSCGTSNSIPKPNSCYLINETEQKSFTPLSQSIACSEIHNSETYRVVSTESSEYPGNLKGADLSEFTNKYCAPETYLFGINSELNYWSYFFPTESEWSSGARWIRCDGQINSGTDANPNFESWAGAKLDSSNDPTNDLGNVIHGSDSQWEAVATEFTCNGEFAKAPGDTLLCRVYWGAKNISDLPLEFGGFVYMVIDGKIFQSNDERASTITVNPGVTARVSYGFSNFRIPCGGSSSKIFMAESPTDIHLLDAALNYRLSCG